MIEIPQVMGKYTEGLKTRDVGRIAETLDDDLVVVLPDRRLDKGQFLAMLRAVYAAFPDWHYEQEPVEVRDEGLAIRWTQGGTHSATFALPGMAPVAATGKKVRIPWHYFFYRVRGNHIVEIRPEPVPGGAPRGILEQIGAILPSA